MNWIEQGGIMTWPLLALSVIVLAVLIDRFLVFTTLALPKATAEDELLSLVRAKDHETLRAKVQTDYPALSPLIEILLSNEPQTVCECAAAIKNEEIVRQLDKRLGVLALASRVAPLMGLLGTIIGIILTFASVSSGRGAVDMSSLAEGIWQALIATAIGLCVAIPSVLAHHAFVRHEESVAFALARFTNMALAITFAGQRP